MRVDGRAADALRPVRIVRNFIDHAEGSVLIEMGRTRLVCTATVDDRVPLWRRGSGAGWVTAEYAMLPRATQIRTQREVQRGRPGGRTMEIQRLIGRSLRAVVDLERLGERQIVIDCDVLQADGGTRTAAVTGAFVALIDALESLRPTMGWTSLPVLDWAAAVSVGVLGGTPLLDLCYEEDAAASVDMNVAATASGKVIEVQGTAEGSPFDRRTLDELVDLAIAGVKRLTAAQREALGPLSELVGRPL